MSNSKVRAVVGRGVDPIARWLLRHRVSPNAVTVVGTIGSVVSPLWFMSRDQVVAAVLVTTAFCLFDLLDGTMARLRGGGTAFGGVLDSTCDRLADGAVFAAVTWWCLVITDQPALGAGALICLVVGQVVPYVKARAEAAGLSADGGIVQRPSRLIVIGVGALLGAVGVPYALAVAVWLLAAATVLTVGQRLAAAYRSAAVKERRR
jgi:CDP-diacylglycerol--glycerol-3-phosphate 3-phosphatidyltransferase